MKLSSAAFLFIYLFFPPFSFGQSDSVQAKFITVHFLYGSKPAPGYKSSERKMFGGIHGGHVSIQVDSEIFSFRPKDGWHIISHHKHIVGGYVREDVDKWIKDTIGRQYTSIRFPVSDSQYLQLKNIEKNYSISCPYDYAFLGMRCASAASDVLSEIGILKSRSNFGHIRKNFYPKRLRRKLLRIAKRNQLQIIRHSGRNSRKWERE